MAVAGRDRRRRQVERDRRGRRDGLVVAEGVGVAEAELAEGVHTPAADRAAGQQGAGVVVPGRDRGRRGAQGDDGGTRDGLVVAERGVVAQAELPQGVVAPAANRAGDQQGAGVERARTDRRRRSTEGDGGRAGDGLVVAEVVGVAQAELARGVEAPAADRAGLQQGARVGRAGGDRRRSCTERDGRGAGDCLVVAEGVGIAQTQLAVAVGAPAADAAGGQQSTGVDPTGRDRRRRTTEGHRRSRADRLVVAEVVGVAQAELALGVLTPAAHGAGGQQRARVPRSGRHRGGRDAVQRRLVLVGTGGRCRQADQRERENGSQEREDRPRARPRCGHPRLQSLEARVGACRGPDRSGAVLRRTRFVGGDPPTWYRPLWTGMGDL